MLQIWYKIHNYLYHQSLSSSSVCDDDRAWTGGGRGGGSMIKNATNMIQNTQLGDITCIITIIYVFCTQQEHFQHRKFF